MCMRAGEKFRTTLLSHPYISIFAQIPAPTPYISLLNFTHPACTHLRYYIIDVGALLFMFNLSQANASTVGPIDTKICMVNLHYIFWLSNTFIKIKFWVVILQDKVFPGSMM